MKKRVLFSGSVIGLFFLLPTSLSPGAVFTPSSLEKAVDPSAPPATLSRNIPEAQKQAVRARFLGVKSPWVENQGEVDDQVLFHVRLSDGAVYLTKRGELVSQYVVADSTKPAHPKHARSPLDLPGIADPQPESFRAIVFTKHFIHSRALSFHGEKPSPTRINYCQGNDPKKWKTQLKAFESVDAHEVYHGIDVSYQPKMGLMEEIFTVHPGAHVKDIRIAVDGVKNLSTEQDGSMVIKTEAGSFKQTRPVAWQMIEGKRVDRIASFRILTGKGLDGARYGYGFTVSGYDSRYPLMIDPLTYSTIFGSHHGQNSYARSIAVDTQGNAYITGTTWGSDFPVVQGYGWPGGGEGSDSYLMFVSKLSADGSSLIYSTYLPNAPTFGTIPWTQSGGVILVDSTGCAYVSGTTPKPWYFPAIGSAYRVNRTPGVGGTDAFVLKFDQNGWPTWSALVGGSGNDVSSQIALDSNNNVFVTGWTNSADFITTTNPYDITFRGSNDVFIFKWLANGSLVSSTYRGGGNDDRGFGIALDAADNVYVTGMMGPGFPANANILILYNIGGAAGQGSDAFVVKLDHNLAGSGALVYATNIGTWQAEVGMSLVVDSSQNVYVTGYTNSNVFPRTANAYDPAWNGGADDVFVLKLDASGSWLQYSTFVGGSGDDVPRSIALDNQGKVYVVGETNSSNFPVTSDALQPALAGGIDTFFLKLDPNSGTSGLLYSTYVGGSLDDYAYDVALDSAKNVYVAGSTKFPSPVEFPRTPGAYMHWYYTPPAADMVFVYKLSMRYVDIGLRLFDGTHTIRVACELATAQTSPLRIARDGRIYSIALVTPGTSSATKVIVQTSSGPRAIAKLD